VNVETFLKGWALLFVAVLGVVILSALPGCAVVKCVRNTYTCGFN